MKAVIIGGGIAGLTAGILLQEQNYEVVVNERSSQFDHQGFAFLMSLDGLAVLKELMKKTNEKLSRQKIDLFSLKRPNNDEVIKIKLDGWASMKRLDLLAFLHSFYNSNILKTGRVFSRFLYDQDKAVAAVFENGDIEYGDIFIGADGSHSKIREALFGTTQFSPIVVKEIVGIANYSLRNQNKEVLFQKIQSSQKGLAFGYIPLSCSEVVWFMQYDVKMEDSLEGTSPEQVKAFCQQLLNDFPGKTKEIIEANDFSNSYFWNTRDFDLLPSFHQNNIVLLGDAAHLALPFTSAGTSNAIVDAKTLCDALATKETNEQAFADYYQKRSPIVKQHVEQGRALKDLFLNPQDHNEREYILPLVSEENTIINKPKPIQILYFTDPVCSTCWIFQPILRKLKLEYGDNIDIEYKMGGLLPSWLNYDKGIIKQPIDAAKYWEEVGKEHNTPIVGDVWLEDPLESSFPPSIAFKAAQLQNINKATLFLRRLKEMVFIEKKNITKWEYIEDAALKCGLDSALLLKDMKGRGQESFLEDLRLSEDMNVNVFPTLFFTTKNGMKRKLEGYHTFHQFEEMIRELMPDVVKKPLEKEPEDLFAEFNNMTELEFIFLSNLPKEDAQLILNNLYLAGKIDKYENRNGLVWMNKPEEN